MASAKQKYSATAFHTFPSQQFSGVDWDSWRDLEAVSKVKQRYYCWGASCDWGDSVHWTRLALEKPYDYCVHQVGKNCSKQICKITNEP